jgi:prevent-host-death family protein
MRKQSSIAEARINLPRLVREAEAGKPIEITRRGESVAVLLGLKEYERLATRARRFSEAWDAFVQEVDIPELGIDPEAIFDVRDRQPGRDVDL